MYAIIAQDGRQYKVAEGDQLDIDWQDATSGEAVTFDRVLAYSDGTSTQLGKPTIAGARVLAEVVEVRQGPKLVVQKFRRRKNSRRKTGHRQLYTRVRINKIELP
jgi:large subunit ribosomal protein L21